MGVNVAAIRFPDGSVKYGLMQRTSGILNNKLFDSQADVHALMDRYHSGGLTHDDTWCATSNSDIEESEPVEIYCNDQFWPGRASRRIITEGLSDEQSYEDDFDSWERGDHYGVPDWAKAVGFDEDTRNRPCACSYCAQVK